MLTDDQIIAHTKTDSDTGTVVCETLFEHSVATAELAKKFAENFDSGAFAEVAAQFHDLGKASSKFQKYIRKCESENSPTHGPDHSTAGARFLAKENKCFGTLLAYAIAGHHAGLPDGMCKGEASLHYRIFDKKDIPEWECAVEGDKELSKLFSAPTSKMIPPPELGRFFSDGFSISFWVRMIFSCLVDADFLATENFMNPAQANFRGNVSAPTISELEQRLENFLKTKFGEPRSEVAKIREEVRTDCLEVAEKPQGIFTLSVPTGGGKTLSSLAFALKHARQHGLERVIYAIPFTSIIEQTAAVFREALGEDAVLEHHCNFVEKDAGETDGGEAKFSHAKLLSENWNAPIVVTTNVQLFESLLAAKPSRCRKLHNLAKSVIILDETQTIPPKYLRPCVRVLNELVKNYGATVVSCTATQPALTSERLGDAKLDNPTEIIRADRNLHERLKRVKIEKISEKQTAESLAGKLAKERQVLAIVNTKRDARNVFEELKKCLPSEDAGNVFHLSTNLCAEHRSQILEKIRKCLHDGNTCRVVSTQLVEAGVDVDFPCVFRAIAGIDSIAQAAGRCNREGKISGAGGRVYVFEMEKDPEIAFLKMAANAGREIFSTEEGNGGDLLSEDVVNKYFESLYWRHGESATALDELGILRNIFPKNGPKKEDDLFLFGFRECGEKFHLIDDKPTHSVIVPWGEAKELCEKLRATHVPAEQRKILKKLQRSTVEIYEKKFNEAVACGKIQLVHDCVPVLVSTDFHYDENLGLCLDDERSAGMAICC